MPHKSESSLLFLNGYSILLVDYLIRTVMIEKNYSTLILFSSNYAVFNGVPGLNRTKWNQGLRGEYFY